MSQLSYFFKQSKLVTAAWYVNRQKRSKLQFKDYHQLVITNAAYLYAAISILFLIYAIVNRQLVIVILSIAALCAAIVSISRYFIVSREISKIRYDMIVVYNENSVVSNVLIAFIASIVFFVFTSFTDSGNKMFLICLILVISLIFVDVIAALLLWLYQLITCRVLFSKLQRKNRDKLYSKVENGTATIDDLIFLLEIYGQCSKNALIAFRVIQIKDLIESDSSMKTEFDNELRVVIPELLKLIKFESTESVTDSHLEKMHSIINEHNQRLYDKAKLANKVIDSRINQKLEEKSSELISKVESNLHD